MYLKRQGGQCSQDTAMRLCLGRQLLLPSSPDSTLGKHNLMHMLHTLPFFLSVFLLCSISASHMSGFGFCFFGTDAAAHIRVDSYYEIDHSKLPTKTPDQLKLVRVIMVTNLPQMN